MSLPVAMPQKKGNAKAGAATEAPPHRHEPRSMILCFVMFLCCVCFFLLLFSLGLWLLPWPGPLRVCRVFGLCDSLCETTAQINSAYFKRTPPPCAGSDRIGVLNIGSSKVAWGVVGGAWLWHPHTADQGTASRAFSSRTAEQAEQSRETKVRPVRAVMQTARILWAFLYAT